MKMTGRIVAAWALALSVGIGCESVGLRSMRIYMQQRNWEKALEQGKMAVAENPRDAEAWFAIAQVAADVDSFDLMLKAIAQTQALTSKHNAEIADLREAKYYGVFNQAVEKYNAGDLALAMERLNTAVAIDSARPNAHKVRGMIHQRSNRYPEALACYAQAYHADTSDVELGRVYANLLNTTGRKGEARGVMRSIYQAHPGNRNVVLNYVALLTEAGRNDSALAVVQNALAQEPNDAEYNMRAGVIFMQKAQAGEDSARTVANLQQAVPYLEHAFDADSANADAAYDLAICYRQLGRLDEASGVLGKLLAARPDDNQARLQLAISYLQEEKPEEAEPHLKQIIQNVGDPTNAEDRQLLSRTYRYLGIIYTVQGSNKGMEAQHLRAEAAEMRRGPQKQAKEQQAQPLEQESRRLLDLGKEMDRLSHEYGE